MPNPTTENKNDKIINSRAIIQSQNDTMTRYQDIPKLSTADEQAVWEQQVEDMINQSSLVKNDYELAYYWFSQLRQKLMSLSIEHKKDYYTLMTNVSSEFRAVSYAVNNERIGVKTLRKMLETFQNRMYEMYRRIPENEDKNRKKQISKVLKDYYSRNTPLALATPEIMWFEDIVQKRGRMLDDIHDPILHHYRENLRKSKYPDVTPVGFYGVVRTLTIDQENELINTIKESRNFVEDMINEVLIDKRFENTTKDNLVIFKEIFQREINTLIRLIRDYSNQFTAASLTNLVTKLDIKKAHIREKFDRLKANDQKAIQVNAEMKAEQQGTEVTPEILHQAKLTNENSVIIDLSNNYVHRLEEDLYY